MTATELQQAGVALFGPSHWQTNLALLLLGKRGSETSRIRNWLAGEPIPAGIRRDLVAALRQKAREATEVADRLCDLER